MTGDSADQSYAIRRIVMRLANQGRRARWLLTTWYPVGFPVAYVLISFDATPNPLTALVRPLVACVLISISLQAAIWLLLRNRERAALATSGVLLLSLAAWVPIAIFAAGAVWLGAVSTLRRLRGRSSLTIRVHDANRVCAAFAIAFTAVAAIPIVPPLLGAQPAPRTAAPVTPPQQDIVLVLLDGYPRDDAARDVAGADTSAFLEGLEDRGFTVAPQSRSNYTATWATLASMLHGEYLESIPGLEPPYPEDAAEQYRLLMEAIESAPMLEMFRERGYEIVTIPPPLEGAELVSADTVLAPPQLTAFELSLIQRSVAGYLVLHAAEGFAFDQHRARVISSLETMTDATRHRLTDERPRFVLAHIFAPHAPIVWDRAGQPLPPPECFPECSIYSMPTTTGLAGQISYVGDLVLEALDAMMVRSPDATIAVMSDHGMHGPDDPESNLFKTLFAIRSPPGPAYVPDDIQPTEILRAIAGTTFGRREPWRGWVSAAEQPLTLTRYGGPPP